MNKGEIKKPWCIYGTYSGFLGFGKIIREDQNTVYILSSENQHYPPSCWESKCIRRFETLEEALERFIEKRILGDTRMDHNLTDEEIRDISREDFPSYFKKELTK